MHSLRADVRHALSARLTASRATTRAGIACASIITPV